MCKISKREKKTNKYIKWKKKYKCAKRKTDTLLNKVLICSIQNMKVERNKILSIIIMESPWIFFQIFGDSLGKPV